ncbi:GspH/FimT family pseudopilin [Variovorax sp. SCN 67-85]|uniref:GspH/FimT family pseudopilin n=1 Tax=Variovorax sp. SCN 67-85 TaxID=1660152 RepID=UPI0025CEA3B2|nr:GspH/FimT family pseudopilin [Variovorax sp. SCN 67-85]
MMNKTAINICQQPFQAARAWAWRGFTLIELMVTIAVMAILLMVAVPSFDNVALGGKLGAYANNLVATMRLARSEAIKRNAAVTVCVSNGGGCGSGGWEQGWIVQAVDGTLIQRQPALAAGFKLTGSEASLVFSPSGVGATAASFTVCRATPQMGWQERVVSISATGRPNVKKTTTGSCS